MDLSEVFLSTDIEFLKRALTQPEGSVQAICVPGGAVGKIFDVSVILPWFNFVFLSKLL